MTTAPPHRTGEDPVLQERLARAGPIPHVYVHLPFCARRCPYCDFNAHAERDDEQDAYATALAAETRPWADHARPETLFVGGGTPTHGPAAVVERTLAGVVDALDTSRLREFTVEANPGSLDREKVRALKRVGVNRVSLGVQSFSDEVLARLGRIHVASDAVRGIEVLREGGIPRFSLDLMLATPGQDLASQVRDLNRAVDLAPEHISTYVLTYEPGTAFHRALQEGRHAPRDTSRELAHLREAVARLTAAGYGRYEISNFARPGAESLHNLAYWRGHDWVGLGAGAHGHIQGLRWRNENDPAAYARRVASGERPEAFRETPTPPQRAFEMLMMGLRLLEEGVDLARIEAATGVPVRTTWSASLEEAQDAGHMRRDEDVVRVTSEGADLLDRVLLPFVP